MTRCGPRSPTRLSRALRRSAPPTPTSASTAIDGSRSRRASGRCRTCRGRPATASACACWSTARGASPRPTGSSRARPARRRAGGRNRARQRRAGDAQGGPRRRRQGRRHLDQRLQARSVRGAARRQDRVPDEAQRGGAGRAGRQLRQLAGAVRRRAEVLRLERRLADHQRLVRTYPQFTTTAADRASGDFQTRVVVDRAQLVGYEYVEDYPWLRRRRKGRPRSGREAEGEAGRGRAATTSSSIRRSCSWPSTNRSATRPSSIARSAGKRTWPAPASSTPATPASCASAPRSSTWSATAPSPAASPPRASTTRA